MGTLWHQAWTEVAVEDELPLRPVCARNYWRALRWWPVQIVHELVFRRCALTSCGQQRMSSRSSRRAAGGIAPLARWPSVQLMRHLVVLMLGTSKYWLCIVLERFVALRRVELWSRLAASLEWLG